MGRLTTALIFHVIGTLTWRHVELSLESLTSQPRFWDDVILYNASDFEDDTIIDLIPEPVTVFPVDRSRPRTALADWEAQVRGIDGFDRYFVLKADFYLPLDVGRIFSFESAAPWWWLPSRLDMKETAGPEHFRGFARCSWREALEQPRIGHLANGHRGAIAVPFFQGRPRFDGALHGYSDAAREHYVADWADERRPPTRPLPNDFPVYTDGFVIHMWHDVPTREPEKLIPGERF